MEISNHKDHSFYKPGIEIEQNLTVGYDDRFMLHPVILRTIPEEWMDSFNKSDQDADDLKYKNKIESHNRDQYLAFTGLKSL